MMGAAQFLACAVAMLASLLGGAALAFLGTIFYTADARFAAVAAIGFVLMATAARIGVHMESAQ